MAAHNTLGQQGEQKAVDYLQHFGYSILERNWRSGHLELDIVAKWRDTIVFVEVKTRSHESEEFTALGAITQAKCLACVYAANSYMEEHPGVTDFRFDVITVVGTSPENFVVRHYENAFNPFRILRQNRRRRYN
ncbi:MAG: YraN family protein [Alloprevotella sp.]|nr:YraN family protein [Alloprevotella sp.]MBR1652690.1 YraN family protein [Alloprevotella sp.]